MKKIELGVEQLGFFQALASPARLQILELLGKGSLNQKQLAKQLGLSHPMVGNHLRKLEEAGLVLVEDQPARRGRQKMCSIHWEDLWLVRPSVPDFSEQSLQIPVGQYVNYEALAPCGLATKETLIGQLDDPRWFADPKHIHASLIWFRAGFVEYQIPNYLLATQQLLELSFSFEICSEAPGYNEQYPSEIFFEVGGVKLGSWISPGDFGAEKGLLNPPWWPRSNTQYGLRKELKIGQNGSFLDGEQLSRVTIDELGLTSGKAFPLRLSAPLEGKYPGGLTLFGRYFGNWAQEIEVSFRYRDQFDAGNLSLEEGND